MEETIRELVKFFVCLFAILGVLYLGYLLVEGQTYGVLALYGFMVGLGMWRYTAK